ncbi:MAG: hypothetical protein MK074_08095 [Phycisphaerales bacterium]|nr:hypothetical protein [Phycisphaerales bacterium]
MLTHTFAWTAAAATSLATGSLLSQAVAHTAPPTPAVSIYSAGIDAWLADSRDAGLREALRRLIIDGPSQPPDADPMLSEGIELLLSLFLGETGLQADLTVPNEPGGSPFAIELQSSGVRGFGGASMLRRVEDLARASGSPLGTPDADAPGMLKLSRPGEPSVWYGAQDDTLLVGVGLPPLDQADTYSEAGLPRDAELLAGIRVNFKRLQPVLAMAAMSAPGGGELLESWGLLGQDPLGVVCAVGATEDTVHMAGHFANYGTHFSHLLPEDGVTRNLLRRIPESACAFECTRIDFGTYINALLDAVEMTGGSDGNTELQQGYDMFHAVTGVDFRDGLIAPLGDSLTFYMSNETGGNGLASLVGLVGLRDAATMSESISTLASVADHAAASESQGYVRFLAQRISGCDTAVSMRFPGLPIPVEPTIAVADGTLVMGLFPQAVAEAVAQFDARRSVLDAEGFRMARGTDGLGGVQIKYMDQKVLAADGFGCMAFVGAALENYTRSRRSPEAPAPPVVPAYTRLTNDMQPGLFWAKLDGPDLIARGTADRSMVAQMTAGVGYVSAFSPLIVAAALGSAMAEQNEPPLLIDQFSVQPEQHDEHVDTAVVDPAALAQRRTRLGTLHTALHLARSNGEDIARLRDLVSGGWLTAGDLLVPGHGDATYLLVGGGAIEAEGGAPCAIAEPSGLPHGRYCVTERGQIAEVGF